MEGKPNRKSGAMNLFRRAVAETKNNSKIINTDDMVFILLI